MKDRKLSIRITEEDLQALHRKAKQAKMTLTEYITRCCLGKQIFVIDGLDEVIRQQKAIGRNLNQLTTFCNMGNTDRYAERNDEYNGIAGDVERPQQNARGTDRKADGSHSADRTNSDRISEYASIPSKTDSGTDLDIFGEFPITGWESERGFFQEALLGAGTSEEQFEEADSSLSYPDNSLNHLGTDTAYLAADLINILDNDHPTEDTTTMKKPHHERKNTLGGM